MRYETDNWSNMAIYRNEMFSVRLKTLLFVQIRGVYSPITSQAVKSPPPINRRQCMQNLSLDH